MNTALIAASAAVMFLMAPAVLATDTANLRQKVRNEDPKLNLLIEKLYKRMRVH